MDMRDRLGLELESFVDAETGVSELSMAIAPTICSLLGHGSPEQAYHALLGIRRRSPGNDVRALFAHMGVDRAASTAEDRLVAYAAAWADARGLPEEKIPTSRTVRRWSKAGLRMLVEQIIEVSGLEPPSLQVDVLHRGQGSFALLLSLYWMHGYEMGPPRWIVVGAEHHATGEYGPADLEEVAEGFFQPPQALEFDIGLPVLIRVVWLGETQPTQQIRHIGQDSGLITMSVMTPGGVGTVVYREGDDIDALADLADSLDQQDTDGRFD